MMISVYIPSKFMVKSRESLEEQLSADVSVVFEGMPAPAGYEVLISGRPTEAQITASPNLHTVVIPWAGVPTETRELMGRYPHIAVHNLHHNAIPTAEMAIALLMSAAKFLVPCDEALRNDDWSPRYLPNPAGTLDQKTALILGYGAIGQHVARVCQALGMTVLATRRQPTATSDPIASEIHPPQHLPQLLPRTDALIICLPLTPETEGLIGQKELALMPRGSLLVNIGRGPIVDQAALYHALLNSHLRSAGLDVWYNYPTKPETRPNTPPADYPFHTLPNIVMSPHRGGDSTESMPLRLQHLAHLLNNLARGEAIPNRVNLQIGY